MTYSSYLIEATTWIKSYIHLGSYQGKVFSAGSTVWGFSWPSTVPITAPGGRDLRYFLGSGRTDDIQFVPSNANNWIKSYIHFGIYTNEYPSAWTEVWSVPRPSRPSITFPVANFWLIFRLLAGWLVT